MIVPAARQGTRNQRAKQKQNKTRPRKESQPHHELDKAKALADVQGLVAHQSHIGHLSAILEEAAHVLLAGLEVDIPNKHAPLCVLLPILHHLVHTQVLVLKRGPILCQRLFH